MRVPASRNGRLSTFIRTTSPGSGGGVTNLVAPARPAVRPADLASEHQIPVAYKGAVAVGRSTPYYVPGGGQATMLAIVARTAGSGASTFRLRVNGTLTGNTITLASGATSTYGSLGNISIPAGAIVDLEILTVGAGLADVGGHIALKG